MPWHPSLSVGIELIDEQHKEWFNRAERLFDAGKKGQAKEYIGELLEFLDSYTKKHFADEERYMRQLNYPGLEEQKKAHAAFIAQLAKLREDYDASGGSISVIINANKIVIDWLTKHISNMDRQIGEFVRSK
ncbi:bacteriohemerythrin [Candidatus Darwinibacter acetoxidans]|jgi:hemerythrin|nr:hemerythrin [Bacillota bacterium]HOB40973.1 bacteriohemerythrin [Limnochordia bacterium]HAN93932.1 hemerythrin [Bacillota bacterium]HPP72192.1 bacteriohemerythrin [Limnochordia bacterium]HPZ80352.1 bacteriohemerythrin [Limnochordia bacterium]